MPIRINLLAESQASEDARRRDPVKRAIWVCALLVVGVLAWSGYLYLKLRSAQQQVAAEDSRWRKNETTFKLITEQQKQMLQAERKLESLVRFSTNRFLWAPVMNALQQAVVPVASEIQLEHLRATQQYEIVPGTPANKEKKTPAKPAASIERISMTLRARDYGNPNEANYNKFKSALANQSYFKNVLQKTDGVRLASTLGAQMQDPADPSKMFYQFSLECRFQEVKHDE